ALGAEGHLDGVGEGVDTREDSLTRGRVIDNFFGSHGVSAQLFSMTPRMSSSRRMRWSSPSIFTSVPEYLAKRTVSPFLTSRARTSPLSRSLPPPTAMTLPRWGFSVAVAGM